MRNSWVLLLPLLFCLASCDNYVYLRLPASPDGTPIENPGRLIVYGIPEAHTARLIDPARDNRLVATLSPNRATDVEAGNYTLLYISPEEGGTSPQGGNYSLNGLQLTLPLLSADGELPQPADLNADGANVTIALNQTKEITLAPTPLTRTVQLDLALKGIETSTIRSVEARLYGVRRTARLDGGYSGLTRMEKGEGRMEKEEERREKGEWRREKGDAVGAEVYYQSSGLTIAGSAPATDPTVSGMFRLLGVDGFEQRMHILVTHTDGSSIRFEQEVSSFFLGFNPPAAATALRLTATLNFGIDEITGTINPWKPGWNEGGTGI